MTDNKRASLELRDVLFTALVASVVLTVAVLDVVLPANYHVVDLYVVVVLGSGISRSIRATVLTAIACIALLWFVFLIQPIDVLHGTTTALAVERGVTTLMIAIAALVVGPVVAREVSNAKLARVLRDAEHDRAADKRMLLAASEFAAIGTWSIDVEDDRFDWSEGVAAMHGMAPGIRPTREEVLELFSTKDNARMREVIRNASQDGNPFREEVQINRADGTQRWVVILGDILRRDGGSATLLHGTIQDITTWKEAELIALAQDNRLAQLTQSLPIIVWTADPQGNIEYFNDALLEYTGSTTEELLADQWVSAVDPRDLDDAVAAWAESVKTGKPYDIEYRVRGADGVYRWHHLSAQAERNDNGVIVRWWGSSINVDANRQLREEADATAAEREMVLDSMSEGIYALDENFRVVYVNASAEVILGRTREELVGLIIWDLFPESTSSPGSDIIHQAMERGVSERATYKSEILDKWLDFSVTRNAVGVTVFMRDITEIKSLSEQLAQSQRLEAIGQLTGGIAHDFNNLLTVVMGGADALVEDDSVADETREMAEMIAVAAERGAELTHRLLAFARMQPLEPQSVDLAQRLRDLAPLLRSSLGENISLVVGPSGGHALAQVDPGQYDNAVLNLAINARDAMPRGGSITIETETTMVDESYVSTHAQVTPGSYVVTTVTDSGEGIPQEDLTRLFDPFFTTKATGKGSGLGLAMVWGFVKQSGGHVTVYSELDVGSAFKLYLPTAASSPVPERPTSDQFSTQPVTGTILLAEDDDLVRRFATDRLRSRGYEVVEVGSGPEALEALASMDRVDLLFTDVIMPGGMTGRDLADAVLELRPGTPVLYASGYTENVILHNGQLDQGVKLLAKPYSARQLAKRIGELVMPRESEGL